jgi:cholest-4-en-3-one 26-monooxygenase
VSIHLRSSSRSRIDPGSPEWFWAISKHADVIEVSRKFQMFSSAKKGALVNQERPDLEIARMMIDTDPPEHTRLRNLVNRGFTPKAMRLLEDHFRDVAHRLIAEAKAEGCRWWPLRNCSAFPMRIAARCSTGRTG